MFSTYMSYTVCIMVQRLNKNIIFRGLNIETVAAVLITIALGLAVDYSAHIAHAFMVKSGTRDERVYQAMVDIGPAVLNGGFSTFLAFVMLMTARSAVFLIFFKIFFLVVTFGVYHGLVFLPVVLSFVGPPTSMSVDSELKEVLGVGNGKVDVMTIDSVANSSTVVGGGASENGKAVADGGNGASEEAQNDHGNGNGHI